MEIKNIYTNTIFLGSSFLKDYLAENGITTDADKKEAAEEFKSKYTLTVKFDFEGVSDDEMKSQLVSTTTFGKMLYNNAIKNWTQEDCKAACLEPIEVSVREMLDTRKTRSLTDEQKDERDRRKTVERAKKDVDYRKKLLAELSAMEA